jgi:hypothetical protein
MKNISLVLASVLSIAFTSLVVDKAISKPSVQKTQIDPIFSPLIPKFRIHLSEDMVVRLPSYVPRVYKKGKDRGQKVYAYESIPYLAEIPIFITVLTTKPNCTTNDCSDIGYIKADRRKPAILDSKIENKSKEQEQSIQIKSGLSGYYLRANNASGEDVHNVYWKQEGIWFQINVTGFKKDEVLAMARSMATTNPISSRSSASDPPAQRDRLPKIGFVKSSNGGPVGCYYYLAQYPKTDRKSILYYGMMNLDDRDVILEYDSQPSTYSRASYKYENTKIKLLTSVDKVREKARKIQDQTEFQKGSIKITNGKKSKTIKVYGICIWD